MRRFLSIFLLFVLGSILPSCSASLDKMYKVGIDPTFYPLELDEVQNQVYGFTLDLLDLIGRKEELHFEILPTGSLNLFTELDQKRYEAVLSPLSPLVVEREKWTFSDPYLLVGPVIVSRQGEKISSIADLHNSIVGIRENSSSVFLLKSDPSIWIQEYPSYAALLEGLANGEVKAALVPALIANNFVRDRFEGALQISSPPLTDEGIRLVTLKGAQPVLIKRFNQGLRDFMREKIYLQLLKQWKLAPPN